MRRQIWESLREFIQCMRLNPELELGEHRNGVWEVHFDKKLVGTMRMLASDEGTDDRWFEIRFDRVPSLKYE